MEEFLEEFINHQDRLYNKRKAHIDTLDFTTLDEEQYVENLIKEYPNPHDRVEYYIFAVLEKYRDVLDEPIDIARTLAHEAYNKNNLSRAVEWGMKDYLDYVRDDDKANVILFFFLERFYGVIMAYCLKELGKEKIEAVFLDALKFAHLVSDNPPLVEKMYDFDSKVYGHFFPLEYWRKKLY